MKTLLAGDIGGTHSRFGLFRTEGDRCRLLFERSFLNQNYPGMKSILEEFLKGQKAAIACIGVAGPVTKRRVNLSAPQPEGWGLPFDNLKAPSTAEGLKVHPEPPFDYAQGREPVERRLSTPPSKAGFHAVERVKITNLPWVIDGRSLGEMLSCRVEIINDLVANAYGVSVLQKRDFVVLNRGKIREENRALISAGTGLGEAILFWNGREHIPSPSEGGHAEFAPRNSLEMELLDYLFSLFDHVSYERVLSGPGLYSIYQFLRDRKKSGREPEWLSTRMRHEDPSLVISEIAQQKRNRLCTMALDLFVSIYGAAAGNLALQAMAVGGVFIGGGIAPGIIWKLKEGPFMEAFKKKGRLSNVVAQIPVQVIMNEKTALLGAAYRAMQLLLRSP